MAGGSLALSAHDEQVMAGGGLPQSTLTELLLFGPDAMQSAHWD